MKSVNKQEQFLSLTQCHYHARHMVKFDVKTTIIWDLTQSVKQKSRHLERSAETTK